MTNKTKIGRPRKDDELRDRIVRVRLTQTEHNDLSRVISSNKTDLSKYMRGLIRESLYQ